MLAQVKENLKTFGVKPNDRLLVAVSGGTDSIFLLHILCLMAKTYPFSLHICHLNHNLRGKESDEDEDFIKQYSDSLKIPCTLVKRNIASEAKNMKRSKQDAARLVRYQVLEETATRERCQWIVTGHQADDQAETFLMRLIRGAGTKGLASIPKKRGNIIRPILHLTREEILDYLQKNHISYREDPSNNLPVYFRNQIRHELLPVLKKYNPNILKVLGHEIEIFAEEERCFEERVKEEALKMLKMSDSKNGILKVAPYLKLPLSLQRGLLRSLFLHLKGDLLDIHFEHVERIIRLAEKGKTGQSIHLPEGIQVYKLYDQLEFHLKKNIESGERTAFTLPIPGEICIPKFKIKLRVSLISGPGFEKPKINETRFDFEKITPPLTVRSRQSGDLIFSERLKGRQKKLQDIFVDLKISRLVRDQIPLISGQDRILWIMGIERDFKSLVTQNTKTALSIETGPFG